VNASYKVKFIIGEDVFAQIAADMDRVDFFLCMNWLISKLERYDSDAPTRSYRFYSLSK